MSTQLQLFIKSQQIRMNDYVNRTKQELKESCCIYREAVNINHTKRAVNKPVQNNALLYDNVVKATNNYVISLKKEKSCL